MDYLIPRLFFIGSLISFVLGITVLQKHHDKMFALQMILLVTGLVILLI
jgi:hypothetical protein